MQTAVSSEKMKFVRIMVEGPERSDSLYIYGVDTPAVVEVLRGAFSSAAGSSEPVAQKPRRGRKPKEEDKEA